MTAPARALRTGSAAGRGTLLTAILASGMVFLDSTVVNVAFARTFATNAGLMGKGNHNLNGAKTSVESNGLSGNPR